MDIVKAFNTNGLHTEITIKGTHENPLFRTSDVELVLGMTNIRVSMKGFDETEKVLITVPTPGGPQQVSYLTEVGLYTILGRSNKPIARSFQKWIFNAVKEIRLRGSYTLQQQLQQTQEQLENERRESEEKLRQEQLLFELKEIELREEIKHSKNVPTLYVYNTDINQNPNGPVEVKIGITDCVSRRIKNYKTSNPFGKVIFTQEIESTNLRAMENIVHHYLHSFRLQGEVFRIDTEELMNIIGILYSFYQLLRNIDKEERQSRIRRINQAIQNIMNGTETGTNRVYHTTETQTDFIEPIENVAITPTASSNADPELVRKFDAFIDEYCVVRHDVEVNAKDIVGQYRLYAREAVSSVTQALTDYLKRRFKYDRLLRQPTPSSAIEAAAGQIMGYLGVTLKPIEYKLKYAGALTPNPEETFVFNCCHFTPSGKTHYQDIWREYQIWRRSMHMPPPVSADEKALKTYLKECPYLLFETVWANNTSGQGYYGIVIKSHIPRTPVVSTTGRTVTKRDLNGHPLTEYATIANAAVAENMSAPGMSRAIKHRQQFGTGELAYIYTTNKSTSA